MEALAALVRSPERIRLGVAALLAFASLFLLPWTVYLTLTLPSTNVTEHWDVVWTGFDLALAATLAATAYGVWRRRLWVQATAAAGGTLLLCDCWFDILLEQPGRKFEAAAIEAVVAELPLAAVCFYTAWRAAHANRRGAAER